MNRRLLPLLLVAVIVTAIAAFEPVSVKAAGSRNIRFGYLDQAGSALCRIAAEKGHFREEGLQIELVRFTDSAAGLAALVAGEINVGAFSIEPSLRFIAAGKGLRIIAGGGTPLPNSPLDELDDTLKFETVSRGIVVLIPPTWQAAEKETAVQLTAALIRAYRTQRQHPQTQFSSFKSVHFDTNPDYYRLESIWHFLGLQDAAMKRDFLSNHVYEEIYCDALDLLQDNNAEDPVFKELASKAVCTPDCCPAKRSKK